MLASLRIDASVPAVHVVGTVGKGTVAAMIERGLRADGHVTGRFLSPHVEDYRERIETAGIPIDRAEVVAFVDRIRTAGLDPTPAFFEITLAMALDLFGRRGVTMAVIEAGVGARRDATMVLDRVAATVITNVSMDHAAALGGTVATIARDKSAAIRPSVPVITGATGVARAVIDARASAARSRLYADPPGGPEFEVPGDRFATADRPRASNQRLAAATLRVLGASDDAVAAGVSAPPLPARRERFSVRGREVILDGAHNPAASDALADSLLGPVVVVFGALARKDGLRTFRRLEQRATHVLLTEAEPGGGLPGGIGVWPVTTDPVTAVREALDMCPVGGTVIVAGSMYLAGRVRAFLRRASATTEPFDKDVETHG